MNCLSGIHEKGTLYHHQVFMKKSVET